MVKEPKLNEHNQKNFFKIFGFFVNLGQLLDEKPQITEWLHEAEEGFAR